MATEDPIKKTISEKSVTGTGSTSAPTAIIDQHGKLVCIGYPDVDKRDAVDQALEDILGGKIDLARSRALQRRASREPLGIGQTRLANSHSLIPRAHSLWK